MNEKIKYGIIYYKDTDNIGDDIQTYAALKLMPRVDYIIDRENIDSFYPDKEEMVLTIMNGWYMHHKSNFMLSPYIYPIPISMHFSANDLYTSPGYKFLDGKAKELFEPYFPIGCRDKNTEKVLKDMNIPCYYSGCLTLTINPIKKRVKKSYICAVDLKEEIVNHLKETFSCKIKEMTHWVNPAVNSYVSFDDRMKNV
jgi:hypothetical protein